MNRKELANLIVENQEIFANRHPISRDISFDSTLVTELHKIITISGVRRSGKTMLLKQLSDQMEYQKEDILFLDFSESSLDEFTVNDFDILPARYLEIYPNRTPVFFLDEIQEIPDFEKGLRSLQNKGYTVFITGSSAQLFSRDIASRLRGKTSEIRVTPLSLKEFLRFRQFEVKPAYTIKEAAQLTSLTCEYLRWGGFPEITLINDPETKKYLLKGYLDTMLLRDVVEKNGVQNVPLMEEILSRAIRSFTKNFSIHKWYNELKSMGYKASKDTLYLYLGYLKETGFVQTVGEYNRAQSGAQKIYLIDNGLYEVRKKQGADEGKLLENMVFRHLVRKGETPDYFQDGSAETDFVTETKLIQVCYSLNRENIDRELAGFNKFEKKNHAVKERRLIYMDAEIPVPEDAVRITDFEME